MFRWLLPTAAVAVALLLAPVNTTLDLLRPYPFIRLFTLGMHR